MSERDYLSEHGMGGVTPRDQAAADQFVSAARDVARRLVPLVSHEVQVGGGSSFETFANIGLLVGGAVRELNQGRVHSHPEGCAIGLAAALAEILAAEASS